MMERRIPDWRFGNNDIVCKKKLKDFAVYANNRGTCEKTCYVSTENLLPNYGGVYFDNVNLHECEGISYQKGDILLSNIRPYLKKIWLADKDGCTSADVLVIRSQDNIDANYLYYQLATDFFFAQVMKSSKGTKMPRGDKEKIMNIPICIYSLSGQNKIASFFSSLDSVIAVQEVNLANLRVTKHGALKKIFSREWRFRDEDGRKFPEWEEKRLGEVSYLRGRIGFRGYSHKDIVSKDEGIISLSPTNIVDNFISFEDGTYITYEKYKESPEIQIKINDILFTKTGSTLGKVGFVNELRQPATINPQIALITAKYNPKYLFYFLRSEASQRYIREIGVGGAIPTLSQEILKRMRIPFPCFAEQQKIADYFQRLDKIIETESAALDAMRKIKRGLLQRLFV